MSPDPACLTKANHLRGLGFGLVAAFLCALVWGQVELDSAAIFLPFAIVQGFVLAKAVHLGTGVMTKWSQALVFALMLLSVLTGDVIATALTPVRVFHSDFSFKYFFDVHWLIEAGVEDDWLFHSLFALLGAGTGLYVLRKYTKPNGEQA
ncbi:MAG: hypothetical protein ABSE40_04990 [Candidatus Sulfotelmatobacter sp.]|jgi:hypothetical protein